MALYKYTQYNLSTNFCMCTLWWCLMVSFHLFRIIVWLCLIKLLFTACITYSLVFWPKYKMLQEWDGIRKSNVNTNLNTFIWMNYYAPLTSKKIQKCNDAHSNYLQRLHIIYASVYACMYNHISTWIHSFSTTIRS